MTVKELIEQLKKEDPDRLVIMAKDPEGNGYSPLSDFWSGAYRAETTEDVIDGVPALILTPIN